MLCNATLISFILQFVVYGGFWIAISLLFLGLFVGCNFCRARDIADFRERIREEGILLKRTRQGSNRQSVSTGNDIEERRDVPVGTTESQ